MTGRDYQPADSVVNPAVAEPADRYASSGNGIDRAVPPRPVGRRTRRLRVVNGRWHGPSWRWLILYAIVLILGLAGVLAAGALGARSGLIMRAGAQATAAVDHYQRGLAHMQAGENALALAELEMALRLQPDNVDARAAIVRLTSATSTPRPTSPPAPTPTPPPVSTPYTLDVLLGEAQSLYEQKEWAQAAERLERVRAANPNYETETVTNLLARIYYNQGLDLVASGQMEAGIREFERVLAVRPQDAQAKEQAQLASAYLQALSYWEANWQKAVQAFGALYALRPDYLDVETRLADALTAYADLLDQRGDACTAAEQYTAALAVRPTAELRSQRDAATTRCAGMPATATPIAPGSVVTGTVPAEGTPPAPAAGLLAPGALYFATWDNDHKHYVLYRTSVAVGARPQPVAEDVRQPSVAPGGKQLAVRNMHGSEVGLDTLDLSGQVVRRVTTFAEDGMATWSPDGKQWIFMSNREGDRRWRLYHAWSEGTEVTEFLTFGRAPAWYPGTQIAYEGCDDRGNRCGIWQMTPDRSRFTPLTDVAGDTAPAWAPDGVRLAFMSAARSGNWDIFLRDGKGNVTPVAASSSIDGLPAWSPDGRWLAFISNRDGAWGLYVAEPGKAAIKIATLPGTLPDWSDEQIAWGPQ